MDLTTRARWLRIGLLSALALGVAGPLGAQPDYDELEFMQQREPAAEDDYGITVKTEADRYRKSPPPAEYPAYRGPKKTIAVLDFENKAKGIYGNWEVGQGLAEMLNSELLKTGRFILVERQALQAVVEEQAMGQSGLVRAESAARVGRMPGAQLLIKGVVSEFEYKSGGSGMSLGLQRFNLGLKTNTAHVGIDVRVIDATTGQILASEHATAQAKASGFNVGYTDDDTPLEIGGGSFQRTPLGEASREAIRKAVFFIIEQSGKVQWSGLVIKANGDRVYINRGASSNVHSGDQFAVYCKGEALIDPQTGLDLGSEEEYAGALVITDVKEKFAIGRLQAANPGAQVKRGDVIRRP